MIEHEIPYDAGAKPLDDSTRAKEEIAFLRNVAGQCQEGSYLHKLFTPAFVAWVVQSIAIDRMPNLYAAYYAVRTEATELRSELAEAKKTIQALQQALTETTDSDCRQNLRLREYVSRLQLYGHLRDAAYAIVRREQELDQETQKEGNDERA